MDFYTDPSAGSRPEWSSQELKDLLRKLITANHVLHHHGLVDAYGHVSLRSPRNPEHYILSAYLPPALVSTPSDLITYNVSDSTPVEPEAQKGYAERFIHGEIYRAYRGVNCVVHSHAEEVLPYVTAGIPLKPIFHMAGFLGREVPVFDVDGMYAEKGVVGRDMLIRNARLGGALANAFRAAPSDSLGAEGQGTGGESEELPERNVVLMRRHGFTTWGVDVETAVYRAVYTKVNSKALTEAIQVRAAMASIKGLGEPRFDLEPLTDDMCKDCARMNERTQDKPWKLWSREVEACGLYTNKS